MTDTSSVANTHSTTEPYPVTVPPPEPSSLNGPGVDSAVPEEEEPYTIRCVCTYDDDDGNTVFCEKCETWQHIDCYYWLEDVPEIHVCEECFPRGIDRNTASERQRSLREQQSDGGGDRKSKRPGAKGQRKKTNNNNNNINSDKVNGGGAHHYHHRSESGAREQPPSKKAKTNHRASNSISSLANIPAFPPDGRKRTATSMSPTKSTGPSIPLYSKEFLHLYDHDQGHADMDSNLFVNLPLAADLASWVTDSAALSRVANGRSPQDIFTWADTGLHRSHWPALSVESVDDPSLEIDGVHPSWKILKTQDTVGKDEIVGELTGKIGHLRDYSLDPQNRWQELRHPEPFVFFHPQLPLYIDSRHEGSMLRYARRSCRPNVTMKTYITNEVEYHFCFVAKEEIPANAEITAMWYLDQQLFGATNGLVKQESNDSAQDLPAICLSNVLANFGGCACEQPMTCLLANVDRRRHARGGGGGGGNSSDSKPATNGKRVMKKPRRKPTLSPSASTSRAASEAAKHPDDDDADSRSASGSGQPGSRDLTPTHDGFGESELSTREKRKIAAAEKKFQQLEQDQAAGHGRRRKRPSGPSSHQPGPMGGSGSGAGGDRILIDTAVGRPSSSSPSSAISPGTFTTGAVRKVSGPKPMVPSPLRRMPYVDSAMQTDMETAADDDLPLSSTATSPQQQQQHSPPRRANFVPLTQRLLRRCQADWTRYESSKTPPQSPSATTTTHSTTPPSNNNINKTEDVDMNDSESPMATTNKEDTRPSEPSEPSGSSEPTEPTEPTETTSPQPPPPPPLALAKPPFSPPWPSTAAHNARVPSLKHLANGSGGGHRPSSDLHVSLPPPSSTVPVQVPATSPGSTTSALSPQSNETGTQAPGSSITAPSPVKKKLSLGDYLIRRGTMTPTSEKPPVMPPPPPSQQQQSDEANSKPDKPSTADADNPSDNTSDVTMQDAPPPPTASNLPSVTF